MHRNASFVRTIFATALFAGASLGWDSGAEAHGGPRVLKGHLTTEQVDCSTLCTEGELTGDLRGTLEFTMASMTETETPNVANYKGVNVITTSRGSFTGTDYGTWNLETGEFVDYTEITSGTGIYAGVHGSLSIMGVFDPVAGAGSSSWRASLKLR
jgi:hypothetical protein